MNGRYYQLTFSLSIARIISGEIGAMSSLVL